MNAPRIENSTVIRRTLSMNLGTAVLYAFLGWVGLALAIPPGYASPVFPAAGFAVAVMLVSHRRVALGVFLGSFALNLVTGVLKSPTHQVELLVPAGIGLGAMLQAWLAAKLIERATGEQWRSMESARDVVLALLLGGPLACVMSATTGIATLYGAGIVGKAALAYSWWSWWAGDTLGVLVCLPLCLTTFYRSRSPWRERIMALGFPMVLALAAIAVAFVAVNQQEIDQREASIRRHGEYLSKLLEQRLIAQQEALASLARLIEVTPDMSYAQFEHFTRITLADNPDIFALSFDPLVADADRMAFEHRVGSLIHGPVFQIKERGGDQKMVRAAKRPSYVVVAFIAPLASNRAALGFDISSEPVRYQALERAHALGRAAATSPIQLVQDSQSRIGALIMQPVYEPDLQAEAIRGEHQIRGYAVGVYRLDEMINIATRSAGEPGLAFEIDDVTGGQLSPVFQSDTTVRPSTGASQSSTTIPFADRQWRLTVYPTAAFNTAHRPWMAIATAMTGLMLSTLLQILLLVTTGRTAMVERVVDKQSRALEEQSSKLKERTAQLNLLFELSPDGLVAIDHDGLVRFVNPAFQSMTAIDAAQVIGHQLADLDRLLIERAEHPDLFCGFESLFRADVDRPKHSLALARPRQIVLQLVGVRSEGTSIDRFVYLRDVTHEAEVDRIKSEFLSHAAHELRTPMASIYGFTELLLCRELDAEVRQDMLETIYRQTSWLIDIINELLDLARIESRRGRDFKIEDVDLAHAVREVVTAQGIDQAQWPVTLNLPEESFAVRADASKLRQALSNVVGNARKYSPDGGTINISLVRKPGFVGIEVKDHGKGMTAEQLEHVGERFWRADSSGRTPGTGLGMAIVKEILELHGGHLSVQSEYGKGSIFAIWLPYSTLLASQPSNEMMDA